MARYASWLQQGRRPSTDSNGLKQISQGTAAEGSGLWRCPSKPPGRLHSVQQVAQPGTAEDGSLSLQLALNADLRTGEISNQKIRTCGINLRKRCTKAGEQLNLAVGTLRISQRQNFVRSSPQAEVLLSANKRRIIPGQ